MKKSSYVWMFLIGGFCSLLMLVNMSKIPEWLTYVFSFASVIGSGIFCSALVTYLVEKQNKKREERQKEIQQKYALDSVQRKFIRLCEREYRELSCYYSKYILKTKDALIREDFSIETVTQKVHYLLTEIEKYEEVQNNNEEIVITMESLELDDIRWHYLVTSNLDIYKSLIELLMRLLDDAAVYISLSIFDNEHIESLRDLVYEIQDIVNFSSDKLLDDGSIIVFKKLFFEHANETLANLKISSDNIVSCQHMKEV